MLYRGFVVVRGYPLKLSRATDCCPGINAPCDRFEDISESYIRNLYDKVGFESSEMIFQNIFCNLRTRGDDRPSLS